MPWKIPPGWVGGFAAPYMANQASLESLPLLDNMENIDKLEREWPIRWPEFSWLSRPGAESSRCYQQFAPYISRIGYTNEGRIYSIICPQQGWFVGDFGLLNIEVTVTGQRGWVDEPTREYAADLTVTGKLWLTPANVASPHGQLLRAIYQRRAQPFGFKGPFTKEYAIEVQTSNGATEDDFIESISGETPPEQFRIPEFARHWDDGAWAVGHLGVKIGAVAATGNAFVDAFNNFVLWIANTASGNMLAYESVLSWNLWFGPPRIVDRAEWRNHAEFWRHSIQVNHHSPYGDRKPAKDFNGRPVGIVSLHPPQGAQPSILKSTAEAPDGPVDLDDVIKEKLLTDFEGELEPDEVAAVQAL